MAGPTRVKRAAGDADLHFDRIAAMVAGLVIIGLAVFLLVRNQPIGDPRLFFVLRVLVSFSAAVLGATIPGFLEVGWKGSGLAVRAGGALALFVITYVFTPNMLAPEPAQTVSIKASSGGMAAQTNNGVMNGGNAAPPTPR